MSLLRGKKQVPENVEDKIIEISAQMQGSLRFEDPVSLKINGQFQGSLETKGTLSVGERANVQANIHGDNIVVAGRVHGDVKASKMLTLMPTAILKGNIATPKLNIVEGAIFQGSCQMSEGLLNMDEVAKYLEIDLREIETLAGSGKIPATRAGNEWKFERTKIDQWAATGQVD